MLEKLVTSAVGNECRDKNVGIEKNSHETLSNTSSSV
jgi:hypothetical protein